MVMGNSYGYYNSYGYNGQIEARKTMDAAGKRKTVYAPAFPWSFDGLHNLVIETGGNVYYIGVLDVMVLRSGLGVTYLDIPEGNWVRNYDYIQL
ncbi:hypothetical protein Ciccas_006312 [Cichlidogyrus casuarinus]|uniref:Uncharacterized protein n=1 Tax=Cichlidogyrus casuarinus TaxID=1844966 RepID=A0ABD2Q656_9PLAT